MFTFSLQFTVYISHGLGNSQISQTGDFLLFKKNTAIKSYSVRGLKELKGLSEDVYKFVTKTTYVKYYFK